jgi:hypothetical protein
MKFDCKEPFVCPTIDYASVTWRILTKFFVKNTLRDAVEGYAVKHFPEHSMRGECFEISEGYSKDQKVGRNICTEIFLYLALLRIKQMLVFLCVFYLNVYFVKHIII